MARIGGPPRAHTEACRQRIEAEMARDGTLRKRQEEALERTSKRLRLDPELRTTPEPTSMETSSAAATASASADAPGPAPDAGMTSTKRELEVADDEPAPMVLKSLCKIAGLTLTVGRDICRLGLEHACISNVYGVMDIRQDMRVFTCEGRQQIREAFGRDTPAIVISGMSPCASFSAGVDNLTMVASLEFVTHLSREQ
eukprot:6478285-Amphidinium_carterae.1